tara:strand:- start:63250 stop:63735 length:486 start_codon:yes stop_codon:yes gene_type:complete
MADIKSGTNLLFLREDQLYEGMELLFFAYRDFTAECDTILNNYGFGRAHHRVIYFIARNPNISVAELLSILKITKQSLSRVLGQLIEDGYIKNQKCNTDKRRRLLRLTQKGDDLDNRLAGVHRKLLSEAYRKAGPDAVDGYRKVLLGIIDEVDRERFTNNK